MENSNNCNHENCKVKISNLTMENKYLIEFAHRCMNFIKYYTMESEKAIEQFYKIKDIVNTYSEQLDLISSIHGYKNEDELERMGLSKNSVQQESPNNVRENINAKKRDIEQLDQNNKEAKKPRVDDMRTNSNNNVNLQFRCRSCPSAFKSDEALLKHKQNIHMILCKKCNALVNKSNFPQHSIKHMEKKFPLSPNSRSRPRKSKNSFVLSSIENSTPDNDKGIYELIRKGETYNNGTSLESRIANQFDSNIINDNSNKIVKTEPMDINNNKMNTNNKENSPNTSRWDKKVSGTCTK